MFDSASGINKRPLGHCDSAWLQEGVFLHQCGQCLYQPIRNTHLYASEPGFAFAWVFFWFLFFFCFFFFNFPSTLLGFVDVCASPLLIRK